MLTLELSSENVCWSCTTCRKQYLWNTCVFPSSPLGQFAMAFLIPRCRSEIMQMSSLGITWLIVSLRHYKNHLQLDPDSQSTTAKVRGNTLLLASVAIATNNFPWYLPYRWVPLILITGLQYLNPSMHGLMRTPIDTLWDPTNNIGILAQES